ncbi:quinate 5-dehydrogenase [Candidatus Pacearchaeota archaeon]|nr:quinate 5-dehydrogenase [Candidatus Pacearchaeota archaeon]
MKNILSVSFGSSTRDKKVELEIGGEQFVIERKGTDGNKARARVTYMKYDGIIDAFGIGGTDLYFCIENRLYKLKDTARLIENVRRSVIVDGVGIKITREAEMPEFLEKQGIKIKGKKAFVPCAVDRYPLAKSLSKVADCTFGDLMTTLGIPIAVKDLRVIKGLAYTLLPFITKLPIEYFYPLGEKQEKNTPKYERYFKDAEIIASDFHFIRRYAPKDLEGKLIITNTTTEKDIQFLKERGVSIVATSTPVIDGRTFGTNVLEAVVCSLLGRKRGEETKNYAEYKKILDYPELQPCIRRLD